MVQSATNFAGTHIGYSLAANFFPKTEGPEAKETRSHYAGRFTANLADTAGRATRDAIAGLLDGAGGILANALYLLPGAGRLGVVQNGTGLLKNFTELPARELAHLISAINPDAEFEMAEAPAGDASKPGYIMGAVQTVAWALSAGYLFGSASAEEGEAPELTTYAEKAAAFTKAQLDARKPTGRTDIINHVAYRGIAFAGLALNAMARVLDTTFGTIPSTVVALARFGRNAETNLKAAASFNLLGVVEDVFVAAERILYPAMAPAIETE